MMRSGLSQITELRCTQFISSCTYRISSPLRAASVCIVCLHIMAITLLKSQIKKMQTDRNIL